MQVILLIITILFAFSCAGDQQPRYKEQQQEIQRQEEERSRTSETSSDDLGPGFDYGTTSSPYDVPVE